MNLARFITSYASRLKNVEFRVDPRFQTQYLTRWVLSRIWMKFVGSVRFRKMTGAPFVALSARFVSRGKIALGRSVTFGERCFVDAEAMWGVQIGNGSSVGPRTRVECVGSIANYGYGIVIGDHSSLGADCFYGCAGGIRIGSDVLVGNFVSFHSENHQFDSVDVPIRAQGVTHQGITIGDDCWIGAKATILDGAHIGDGCVIAAGSVVVGGTYPPDSVYGGVPAKFLKSRRS